MKMILTTMLLLVAASVPAWSLVQPDSVPGPIDVSIIQEFPSIADIVNKPAAAVPVYGLYSWYTYYQGSSPWQDTVMSIGWKTVRISSGPGSMPADDFMRNLADRNFEIMYTLNAVPREQFGAFRDSSGNPHAGNDQAFIDSYLVFVDTMLTRYGPGGTYFDEHPELPDNPILYWEICNEPNLHYLLGAASWDSLGRQEIAALYAKLLVQTYAYIRNKPEWDPIKVVAFSACGASNNDLNWPKPGFMEFVFQADSMVAHSYDIMSNHPYVSNKPPDSENLTSPWYHYSIANSHAAYREIMSRYGNADKPVWFTEIGWHRENGTSPAGERYVSEQLQAAYVCRLYATAMRLGVERVHVMFLLDADGFNGGFFNNSGRTRYESANAVQSMVELMPNPKLAGVISDGVDGCYAQQYVSDHTSYAAPNITMVWNVAGPITVDVPVNAGGEYAVYDMLGEVTMARQTVNSTTLNLEVGPCPVYVKEFIPVTGISPAEAGALPGGVTVRSVHSTAGVALSFKLEYAAPANITVTDAGGNAVQRVSGLAGAAGWNTVPLDGLNVKGPGVYFYVFETDGLRVTGKFINN